MDTKFAYKIDKRFIKDAEREAIVTAEKNLLQSRLLLKSKQENEEYVKEFLDPDIDRLNLYISQWQDNCVVPVKSLASEYFFLRSLTTKTLQEHLRLSFMLWEDCIDISTKWKEGGLV